MQGAGPTPLAPGHGAGDRSAADTLVDHGSITPYPGLRPFRRDESDIFFGREELADELLRRLGRSRFLGVVGVSGCGKSSLLRAGMIPALESGFLPEAGVQWGIVKMRPGNRPIRRLAESLHKRVATGYDGDGHGVAFIEDSLRRGPLGLVEVLREHEFPHGHSMLVLVDQFEEIFRYRAEGARDEAEAFVALLLGSAAQRAYNVFVLLGMRSEYLGQCAIFTGLPEALNDGQFLTPRLTREQRREAIEGPAAVFGGKVQPALVNQILNDMGSDPNQLPVMQHLLMRMWTRARAENRQPIELTLADYNAVGGLSDALSRHADEVFNTLTPDQRRIAEVLFRCVTGAFEHNPDTRRPVPLKDVAAVAGVPWKAVRRVVQVFRTPGNSFLLPPVAIRLEPDTVLDITHESLILRWRRLREWVRDEAFRAECYRKLVDQARAWRDGGRDPDSLLRGAQLAEVEAWRQEAKPTAAWAARYGPDYGLAIEFLKRSRQARRWARVAACLKWSGRVVGAVAVAGLVVGMAVENGRLMQRQRSSYELAAQAGLTRDLRLGLLETSTWLALEAYERAASLQSNQWLALEAYERAASLQSNQALQASVSLLPQPRMLHVTGGAERAIFTPEGTELLVAGHGLVARVDPRTGRSSPHKTCRGCGRTEVLAIDPSGTSLLLAARDQNKLFVVDARSGERKGRPVPYATREVAGAALGPGGRIATTSRNEVRAFALDGRGKTVQLRLAESGRSALSPDARFVASWDPDTGRLKVTRLVDGRELESWNLSFESVTQIAFSPDESYVGAATREGRIRVWQLGSTKRDEAARVTVGDYPARVEHLVVSPQARFLAATQEGTTRVFDLRQRGRPGIEVVRIENLPPKTIAFGPSDRSIAIVGSDMTGVWGLSPGGEAARFTLERPVTAVAISPDKRLVAASQATAQATARPDRRQVDDGWASQPRGLLPFFYSTVSVLDVSTGDTRGEARVNGDVAALAFAQDSNTVIAAMRDGTVHVIGPLRDGAGIPVGPPSVFRRCGMETHFAGLSGDGTRLALTSAKDNACVFDVATGRRLLRLKSGSQAAGRIVGLSRDATSVTVVGHDGGLRMWRFGTAPPTKRGDVDAKRLPPFFRARGPLQSLVVSPTGSEIAFTTLGRGVTVVRSLGGSPVVGISHQDVIRAIAFNADETVLATGGEDGYARVWDLAGSSDARREMTRIPNRDPVSALAFSGDAEYLVVANDREVRVVRWRSDDLVREACGRISRSLTPEEWKPYLNGESPTPTCPALVEHPGTLLEQAARAISEGRMQDAQSLYRRAKRAGQRPTPADWKKLCWGGSFWGHVNDVWFACKRAVSEEPDEPLYRDARGVARVLRGDRQGALDDFRFFLAKSAGTNIRRECRERRERWIAELERGADPFEAGEMRELWKE